MIVVKLQGGLGNQMFQWSIGRHLSNKHGVDLYLDINFYRSELAGTTKRNFSLDKFPKLDFKLFDSINKNSLQFYRISEPGRFTHIDYDISKNLYLDGYFQDEKYFLESAEIIRRELRPDEQTLNKFYMSYINSDNNNISLHIRRTDYLTSNGFHPVQSIDYYKKAIEVIGDYDNIFVFSDDIKWCRENLKFNKLTFIEGLSDLEDLWLMSLCQNNIIANSSFSWWAAWMNTNQKKKVIAPKLWFGAQTNIDPSDIIPNSWIKI